MAYQYTLACAILFEQKDIPDIAEKSRQEGWTSCNERTWVYEVLSFPNPFQKGDDIGIGRDYLGTVERVSHRPDTDHSEVGLTYDHKRQKLSWKGIEAIIHKNSSILHWV